MKIVRLGSHVELVSKVASGAELPYVALEDLASGEGRVVNGANPSIRAGISPGMATAGPADVLFGKLRPYLRKSLLVTEPMHASSELLILRPRTGMDSRWLSRLVQSQPFLDWAVASSEGTKMPRTSWERLRDFRFAMPDFDQQRRIADFLDAETARVDALISMRRHMIHLMAERRQAVIDQYLMDTGTRVRVRHLIGRITSGPRGWAQYVSDEGRLFLRIANVARNDIELRMDETAYVQPPYGAESDRTEVREGDVLLSITADVGSVGVARGNHAGAAISQHIALMTPRACSGDWLALSLCTSAAKAQLDAARYGGTKTQLNLDDVRDVAIRLVDQRTERKRLDLACERLEAIRRLVEDLHLQIELLEEHRHALITATVTGQAEIPEAT